MKDADILGSCLLILVSVQYKIQNQPLQQELEGSSLFREGRDITLSARHLARVSSLYALVTIPSSTCIKQLGDEGTLLKCAWICQQRTENILAFAHLSDLMQEAYGSQQSGWSRQTGDY